MGRIIKKFEVTTGAGHAIAKGQIDSGADQTVLDARLACRVGLNIRQAARAAVYVAEGTRVVGFILPTIIAIGSRSALVKAFVPSYTETASGQRKKAVMGNLIGADFLQASRAKLDYERPHSAVFGGFSPFRWRRVRPTAADLATLRKFRCP